MAKEWVKLQLAGCKIKIFYFQVRWPFNFLASVAHFFWPSSSHDEYGNLVTGVASSAGRLYSRNARLVYRRARGLGLSVCYGKDYVRWPHQDHIPGRQWFLKGTVYYTLTEEEFQKWTTDSQTWWRTDLLGKEMATVSWQESERNCETHSQHKGAGCPIPLCNRITSNDTTTSSNIRAFLCDICDYAKI